jgi:hypothetical protein
MSARRSISWSNFRNDLADGAGRGRQAVNALAGVAEHLPASLSRCPVHAPEP